MENLSNWFAGLSQKERKELINTLFSLRNEAKEYDIYNLYPELLKVLDNEYHRLKTD